MKREPLQKATVPGRTLICKVGGLSASDFVFCNRQRYDRRWEPFFAREVHDGPAEIDERVDPSGLNWFTSSPLVKWQKTAEN
ncbi:MAG: hypothetical protein K2X38_16110 [Gemmataceae bacterium]|nr:hypothetical protein [Gemmataceae bacterium]